MITTYAQLDGDTRDYLAAVKRNHGKGAPGIYVPGGTNPWPVLGCLVGGMMIIGVLSVMMSLPKSAWAVAMVVTAGLWLGGWLVAYPFRRWFGTRLGTFTYFDPNTVYQVNADEVTITDIQDMTGLDVNHTTSNNAYAGSILKFKLPGRGLSVKVKNQPGAIATDVYYQALGEIESDPKWSRNSSSEQGAVAVYTVKNDAFPEDLKLVDLAIEMPDAAVSTDSPRGGGGMFLRYIMLLAVAGAIFAGVWQMLQPLQDHEAFREAKKHGVQGYRDYLLDDRNTHHRDEAKQAIRDLYKPKIDAVQTQAKVPEYQKGLAAILNGLSETEGLPVLSIRVTEEDTGHVPNFTVMKSLREKAVRTALADALGTQFGVDYMVFVDCPADAKPHVELNYKADDKGHLLWRLSFRGDAEGDAITGPEHAALVHDPITPSRDLVLSIFRELLGVDPPPINNLPIGGGDFE